ncbi:MAG: non-heme iron oxygenase ferredoxin subunit [Thaumarchaeota archaeon]|nr:non-heme iron oxygenase ferredoxin subunit [Nitrososphaerota archaeon]
MTSKMKVATVDEIAPGRMKGVVVEGKKVLIANLDGSFYATGSVCTHVGGPLDKGRLEGHVITCPWHGSQFDITSGKALRGPAVNPEPTYKVCVEGNDVILEV